MVSAIAELLDVEAFLALPNSGDYELVDGKLKEREMALDSAWVAGQLFGELRDFAPTRTRGLIMGDGAAIAIFAERPRYAPRPDGLFISFARLGSQSLRTSALQVAPELVIEVVSPTDVAAEVEEKVLSYLGAGVDVVWVAYPRQRTIHVYRRSGAPEVLSDGDTLRGDGPLDGLAIPVSRVFAEPQK